MKKIIITLLAIMISTAAFSEEFAVIVNAANDGEDPRGHFLLLSDSWANGAQSVPFEVDPQGNSKQEKAQESFLNAILQMSPNQYRQHWVDRKAGGNTVKPTLVRNYDAVKTFVMRKKGGIGYLPKKMAGGNVKIIATFNVE